MIALTGAGGNIGRHLAQRLAASGTPARLLVREEGVAGVSGSALQETVTADLDRPETLDAALIGVTQLFLVSPGPNTPAQDAAAIAAAERAGVRHIVLLSSLGVELGGIGGGRAHAPGEDRLTASSMGWTILRPNEFMTNTRGWLTEITARGTVSVPTGDETVGYIDPADIAAVAFTALTTPDHVGKLYRLTGPEALTTAEAAARIGAALGKDVRHVDVSDETFRANAQSAHMPQPLVNLLSEYCGAVKEGRMAMVTSDVAQVTGQRPQAFLDWARATFATA